MTMTGIARVLATEGIFKTCQTVKNTIPRWQKTGFVRDYPRSGAPKRVPEVHYCCIGEAMTGNDKLTASELRDILSKKFGAQKFKYSMRTVARLRTELVSSTILGCAGKEVF